MARLIGIGTKRKGRSIPCLACVQGRACRNTALCFYKIDGSRRIASHARGRWRLLLIDRCLFDHDSQLARIPAVRECCEESIRMSYKVHSDDTYIRPARISTTSVPASLEKCQFSTNIRVIPTHMRSTLVSTPIVRVPSGSTSRASLRPSEFAKSVLAAVTARMIHEGLEIYFMSISRICFSISRG